MKKRILFYYLVLVQIEHSKICEDERVTYLRVSFASFEVYSRWSSMSFAFCSHRMTVIEVMVHESGKYGLSRFLFKPNL